MWLRWGRCVCGGRTQGTAPPYSQRAASVCLDQNSRVLDPLELELWEVVSHPTGVLGSELRLSARAVNALICPATSAVLRGGTYGVALLPRHAPSASPSRF